MGRRRVGAGDVNRPKRRTYLKTVGWEVESMFTLNEVWENVFTQLMRKNGGILAYLRNKKEYVILQDNTIKRLSSADKITLLFGKQIEKVFPEKTPVNVMNQLLNGKVLVKKQGAAAYQRMITNLCNLIFKKGIENQLKDDGQRFQEIMRVSIRVRHYLIENAEKKDLDVLEMHAVDRILVKNIEEELDDLTIELFYLVKEQYIDALYLKEELQIEQNYPILTKNNYNQAWEYLALITYVCLLSVDYLDMKRTGGLEREIERLKKLINKTGYSYKREPAKPELKTYLDMIRKGRSALDICQELVENDNILYNLGIGHENEGNPELWAKFLEANPETFLFMVYRGKIIGNYSLVTLSEEQVEQLECGKLCEADFDIDKNIMIFTKGVYTLYILNYSVNLGFSTVENRVMLWSALIRQLERYAEQEIYFNQVYVNVFRTDHEELYKQLGFQFVCVNNNQGRIYCLKKFPDDLNWNNKQKLIELYKKNSDKGGKCNSDHGISKAEPDGSER